MFKSLLNVTLYWFKVYYYDLIIANDKSVANRLELALV